MREIFIAITMLSMPVALVLVVGKTAVHMGGGATASAEPMVVASVPVNGAYVENCASCHGADAAGSARGPSLLDPAYAPEALSDREFRLAILRGRRARLWDYGDMPAIAGLDDAEIAELVRFIRDLQAERRQQES